MTSHYPSDGKSFRALTMGLLTLLLTAAVTVAPAGGHVIGPEPQIKVFKYDQSTQCNNDGISLPAMAKELRRAGIDVQCSQKARDGFLYPAVCGGPTGIINVYQINPENIPDAQQLGFHPVSRLSEYQDRPCFWDD